MRQSPHLGPALSGLLRQGIEFLMRVQAERRVTTRLPPSAETGSFARPRSDCRILPS